MSVPPTPANLTPQQKFELVNLLLACPCFESASSRQAVSHQLAAKIHTSISLGATHNAKEEALAIVDTCLNFEQGLAELIQVVSFFDGGDNPTTAFTELAIWLNLNDLAALVAAAAAIGEPTQREKSALPVTPLLLPKAVSQLPRRNPLFTGREQELQELHTSLAQSSTVSLIALSGLGGIGKTSLALEYCYRHREEYGMIL